MDILYPFNESKLKPYLKMAIQRIKINSNKKSSIVKIHKREIAGLLSENKEENARIKAEAVIRDDFIIESYKIIETFSDLVHERAKYLSSQKECPDDLIEAISSLIWASSRVDIEELVEAKNQFRKKYGSTFVEQCAKNQNNYVNIRLLNKLKLEPPPAALINRYLEEIAKEFHIDWTPTDRSLSQGGTDAVYPSPTCFSVPMAPGSELRSAYQRKPEDGDVPSTLPSSCPVAPATTDDSLSFDDLTARFNELQKSQNKK